MPGKVFNPIKGVFSFNGRKGLVIPQIGDYTAAMVGAAPAPLDAGIILYVDSSTGSDSNPGTQSEPFATVQAAVNSLPKNLGGYTAAINIVGDVGDTNDILVSSFYNGAISLYGGGGISSTVGVSISIVSCQSIVNVLFLNFSFGLSSGQSYISINDCYMVNINNCNLDGINAQGNGISILGQSNVGVTVSTISNCNRAFNSQVNSGTRGVSGIWVYTVSGTGNTLGAMLFSTIMTLYDYTLSATTAYGKIGGLVVNSDGTVG